MTPSMWMTRATLRDNVSVSAIAPLLLPVRDGGQAAVADHRLVWSIMTTGARAQRDFLWRREKAGHFLILAPKPGQSESGLFDLETKAYAPALESGDRLSFLLRANPTVAEAPASRKQRGRRRDAIMHALYALPQESRAELREDTVQRAGTSWLRKAGARLGFSVDKALVESYESLTLPRSETGAIKLGVADFRGILTVTDAVAFQSALRQGVGRAKAFGCGLLLVRRHSD